jgi:hypothetical protein
MCTSAGGFVNNWRSFDLLADAADWWCSITRLWRIFVGGSARKIFYFLRQVDLADRRIGGSFYWNSLKA